jgi:hypothetical protein
MRHITISGHHVGRHEVAGTFWIVAAFWVVAGIVALIGPGGGLTRLAAALAIVTTEWWILSEAEHRLEKRRGDYYRDPSSPRTDRSTRPEKNFGTRVMAWPQHRVNP